MPVITTDELREHLNLPADQDEALLAAKIAAAEKHLEAFTGQAFLTQARTVTFGGFGIPRLDLPVSPVRSVASVKYFDTAGVEQTLAADAYVLNDGALYPAAGKSWPCTARLGAAVSVSLTAGYGDDPADVPAPLGEAVKQLAAHWYENREAVFVGNSAQAIALPLTLFDLIEPYRRRVF